jgi:hypothetical protein
MAKVCIACGEPVGKHRAKYCSDACGMAKRLERKRIKHNTDPEARRKQLVRLKCRYLKLERQPCVVCRDDNTEKHHYSYDNPRHVVWLCRRCHNRLHRYQFNELCSVEPSPPAMDHQVLSILERLLPSELRPAQLDLQ